MPSINALGRELDTDGLSVLLVNLGEERAIVERAAKSRGYTARIVLDPYREVADLYAIRATPTVFLVGRNGLVRGRAIGPRAWTGVDGQALLRLLLAEPAPDR